MKHYTIPIFVPELACPHRCIFCNQQKISGTLSIPTEEIIKTIIETNLSTMDWQNNIVEIGFFGGNFTGIEVSTQIKFLKIAHHYIQNGQVKSIRLSTRPDYINTDILKMLKNYQVKTIELGAQSFDDKVLSAGGRGHTVADTITAAKLITNAGFELGLQMMIGLPLDTKEKALNTAEQIAKLRASNTRIYPALVIKDTKLHELYNQQTYAPLSLDQAIDWCKDIIPIFEAKQIKILRVGLHPAKDLSSERDLIAGPFHPAFKQLVLSELWWDILNEQILNRQTLPISVQTKNAIENKQNTTLHIYTNPQEINYAAGYSAKNKKRLLKLFKQVTFQADENLTDREVVLKYK